MMAYYEAQTDRRHTCSNPLPTPSALRSISSSAVRRCPTLCASKQTVASSATAGREAARSRQSVIEHIEGLVAKYGSEVKLPAVRRCHDANAFRQLELNTREITRAGHALLHFIRESCRERRVRA